MLKKVSFYIGKFFTKNLFFGRLYLRILMFLLFFVTKYQKNQIINHLISLDLKEGFMKPQKVTLGEKTKVFIAPHKGEFDFAAILGGKFYYEEEVFSSLEKIIDQYDLVIEIGANVGIFTCFFGQKLLNNGGVVFSFEPSQTAIKRLVYNLEINRLYNVSVFSCGITDRFGLYDFYEPEGHLSNGSIVSSFAQSFSDKVIRNKVIFLDGNLINGLIENRRPSKVLIKIDAEGHDCVVMRSLIPIISAYKPDIIIEVLPDNRDEIFQTFQQVCQGYKFFGFDYGGLKVADSFRPLVGRDMFLSFSG